MMVGAGSSDDGGRMVTNSVKLFLMAISTHTLQGLCICDRYLKLLFIFRARKSVSIYIMHNTCNNNNEYKSTCSQVYSVYFVGIFPGWQSFKTQHEGRAES